MDKNTSKKNSLNKQDYINIGKTILAIYSPVILLFLDQIQDMSFDWKILAALWVSVTVDIVRRFVADNRKNLLTTINSIDTKELEEFVKKQEKKEQEKKETL